MPELREFDGVFVKRVIREDTGPLVIEFGRNPLFWNVIIPYWAIATALTIAPGIAIFKRLRRRDSAVGVRCNRCGYDLRATSDRCPECGTPTGKTIPSREKML